MELLIALVASVAFALTMRDPLKAHPAVFYVAAVLVSAAFASHAALEIAPVFGRALFPYVQRCLFAFGLFSVVMFVGALPEGSRLRRHLNPERGKLSVVASILVAGHVANYAQSYLSQVAGGLSGLPATMLASFAASAVLVALLALLAVTSLDAVRRRMDANGWKQVQMLAYPFYLLIFVHVALILGPSASSPEQKAFFSIIVYTVIVGSYAAARLARVAAAPGDGEAREESATTGKTEATA
ncbi:MAG: ferric reductase-like transmembrane domain-containing protein [Eggerthella lenta]|jgi:sulfoxide reductase heme-binding subunit YedZ|uniref:ferric reductase-like transmembrane domain-containing protein n=1 Tax=Eggerthella sp. TaxID=1929886 RepID=UPI002914EAC1|nr:ferric reductase-like transmembrane domain-containing protein [Eggerthella sp.]MDU5064273.1 ferric reductase-like transmembrane domain-containing protein [Eggerthella sp.]MDY3949214.1 ferric reductase-like transmembrane domain-containing protein [Eggerthella lenta]